MGCRRFTGRCARDRHSGTCGWGHFHTPNDLAQEIASIDVFSFEATVYLPLRWIWKDDED